MPSKRLFVAIPLPEEIRNVLASCSNSMVHPDLRWVPPENLHITLLFIGNVEAEQIPDIKQKLVAVAETDAFTLQCEAITTVKRRGKTSMVWARFKESTSFVRLAKEVSKAIAIPPDHHPLPHVTMARIKQRRNVPVDNSLFPAINHFQFEVNSFGLWESQLYPKGSVYSVLEEWKLRKN